MFEQKFAFSLVFLFTCVYFNLIFILFSIFWIGFFVNGFCILFIVPSRSIFLFSQWKFFELYVRPCPAVFFVQSILADRYIHRRELRLISLESLSSLEYESKTNFLYLFFTGSYRGLNFEEIVWIPWRFYSHFPEFWLKFRHFCKKILMFLKKCYWFLFAQTTILIVGYFLSNI